MFTLSYFSSLRFPSTSLPLRLPWTPPDKRGRKSKSSSVLLMYVMLHYFSLCYRWRGIMIHAPVSPFRSSPMLTASELLLVELAFGTLPSTSHPLGTSLLSSLNLWVDFHISKTSLLFDFVSPRIDIITLCLLCILYDMYAYYILCLISST